MVKKVFCFNTSIVLFTDRGAKLLQFCSNTSTVYFKHFYKCNLGVVLSFGFSFMNKGFEGKWD
jgi:hypothetical protein